MNDHARESASGPVRLATDDTETRPFRSSIEVEAMHPDGAPPRAFLLDFDGVILDSAEIKTSVFAQMYADQPEAEVEKIVAHQRHHGGVSRRRKFAHFERVILSRDVGEARLDELCSRFGEACLAKVMAAPPMPGALSFLEDAGRVCDLFVVSGTPEAELRHIVDAIGLAPRFLGVYGAPRGKAEIFEAILREHTYGAGEVVAVGDAVTECEAAAALGLRFVGIRPQTHDAGFPEGVLQVAHLSAVAALFAIPARQTPSHGMP